MWDSLLLRKIHAILAAVALLHAQVLELSEHKFGCRVIQKMLEVLPSPKKSAITAELMDKVVQCVYDMHGLGPRSQKGWSQPKDWNEISGNR